MTTDEFAQAEEFARALRDDQRFGAEIAARTRAIAVSDNDLERHREKLVHSIDGWVTLDLSAETKERLIHEADQADMTVADYLEHVIATAPRVISVRMPHHIMEKGRAHWPGLPDEQVVERMVVAGGVALAREKAAEKTED